MMMNRSDKETLSHVERPNLPWRKPELALTECGKAAQGHITIPRDEFIRRWKEWGQQRVAMTTCMTCLHTAERWAEWEEDPLHAMQRAIAHEPYGGHWSPKYGRTLAEADGKSPLRIELRAIAILVERHREEFDGLVDALKRVVRLDVEKAKRVKM
jgi:hypothetical protein